MAKIVRNPEPDECPEEKQDFIGRTSGLLTVTGFCRWKNSDLWYARCCCGNTIEIAGHAIKCKSVTSCGKCEVESAPLPQITKQQAASRLNKYTSLAISEGLPAPVFSEVDVIAIYEKASFDSKGAKRCSICGASETGTRHHIDHDHSTAVLRGVLCSPCNTALGSLKDSVWLLLRAAWYILKHRARGILIRLFQLGKNSSETGKTSPKP